MNNKLNVIHQVWDTSPTERFRTITSAYYRNAHFIYLVFDMTNNYSLESINSYFGEVDRYASDISRVILIGTKRDLYESMQKQHENGKLCEPQQIQQIRQKYKEKIIAYYEISSKTGKNVEKALNDVMKLMECAHIIYQKNKKQAEAAEIKITSSNNNGGAVNVCQVQ